MPGKSSSTTTQPHTIIPNMKTPGALTRILLLCALPLGTACAQDTATVFNHRYEESLLDSLIRYEMIKPVTFNLQKENVQLRKEKQDIAMQLHIVSFRCRQQGEIFTKNLKSERGKQAKRIGVVAVIAFIIGISL